MTKFFEEAKGKNIPTSVLIFVRHIIKILKADLAFQASEFTRWSTEQGSKFMTSLLMGYAPSKFIFADIESCYKHAVENENQSDIDYFKKWLDAGVKLLNLDSNNRTINIFGFIRGKFGIEEGRYSVNGHVYNIREGVNNTWKTMPKALKRKFFNAIIDQHVYTNVGREQLSDIFERINDGKPLNAPEKRNARTSKIAAVVRDLANQYLDWFINDKTKWFSEKDKIRRGVDDFIAGLAYIFFEGIDQPIGETTLGDMYRVDSDADKQAISFKKFFNSFMKFISEDMYSIPNRNSILDLFVIYMDMKKDGKELKTDITPKQFINAYIKRVADLLDEQEFNLNPFQPRAKEKKTFEKILGGRQHYNNQYRRVLIRKGLDLSKYFVQLDSKRVVDDMTKFVVAVKHQNGVTPENKEIDLSELQSSKYHKGHKDEPHRDGGKATKENTVVQENIDNWKLGSKPVNA